MTRLQLARLLGGFSAGLLVLQMAVPWFTRDEVLVYGISLGLPALAGSPSAADFPALGFLLLAIGLVAAFGTFMRRPSYFTAPAGLLVSTLAVAALVATAGRGAGEKLTPRQVVPSIASGPTLAMLAAFLILVSAALTSQMVVERGRREPDVVTDARPIESPPATAPTPPESPPAG